MNFLLFSYLVSAVLYLSCHFTVGDKLVHPVHLCAIFIYILRSSKRLWGIHMGYIFSTFPKFKEIIFTILSQENSRHEQRALKLKNEINKETNFSSTVYQTHIDLKHIGDWTVLPILPIIWKKHKQKFSWAFFCTDETKVDTVRLKDLLETFAAGDVFLGRGLGDDEATIIHHFASDQNFKYPLFSSGFALHYNLIKRLVEKINDKTILRKIDFSIDASHELALFIKENAEGTVLTHSPLFCINYKKNCVTYIRNNYICDQQPVDIKKIFFAVKTCNKFHKERVPVVQKTWAQWTYHITFFSDAYDKNIPTVQLQVPNTERGHCAKTEAILKEIKKNMEINRNLDWAVISDDDTLFSTYRLQELLGCYNHTEAIAIGERYGYNVLTDLGYNYITGGGGIVLSRKAIKKFFEGSCSCPSDSAPDDMFLFGICLQELKIKIVHVPLFHQARPNDYNGEYLLVGPPISFHKHWMTDPVQVYKDWFELSDLLANKKMTHTEL